MALSIRVGSYQPYHLPFQRWPFLREDRPTGSTFVIWQMSTRSSDQARLIFMCVPSQDFNLVKDCGIYFPKHCPNSVLFFFFFSFNCLLGLRWSLNALNYSGSPCLFEHLCVIQITGGHRAWLTTSLLLQHGKTPRILTRYHVVGVLSGGLKRMKHFPWTSTVPWKRSFIAGLGWVWQWISQKQCFKK